MGRPERPLDPDAGPAAFFAARLRELRRRAGTPGYRRMAEATGLAPATLARAASGHQLPTLPVALAYVRACGADEATWRRRWQDTATEVAASRAAESDRGVPPYQGLMPFDLGDTERFFGRERLVEHVLRRLGEGRLLAVVGASGVGKSSLLRAGLLAALAERTGRDRARVNPASGRVADQVAETDRALVPLLMAPGERPLTALRRCLSGAGDSRDTLVVVDQFEEVFTACRDRGQRQRFIAALVGLVTDDSDRRVVLGIRADCYARCAEYPALAAALADHTLLVGPMTGDELERIVTGPARAAGLTVERALVARILADADGRPGVLPLLSHALLETWRQRQGPTLTLAGYEAAGGVSGAIAATAEQVWSAFTPVQQGTARHLLVRLTALGVDGADSRRRVRRAELNLPEADAVIEALVSARLLAVDDRTVEITHEALLRAWPRLVAWLADDRDALRTHRQLTDAALAWDGLDRDEGALYRGARLAMARERAANPAFTGALTALERQFLKASIAVELAEQSVAARRAWRWRQLTAALAALVVVVLVAAATAVMQWRTTLAQRQEATSRQLAAQALSVAATDADRAARLSLQAYRAAPTIEARGAVLSTAARPAYTARLRQIARVQRVAYSPDGASLAALDAEGRITVWDLRRRTTRPIAGERSVLSMLAWRADGRSLVVASPVGVVRWDLADGTAHPITGPDRTSEIGCAAVAPDGAVAAVLVSDHTSGASAVARIELWSVAAGTRLGTLAVPRDHPSCGLVFSPDGRLLASGTAGGPIDVWDLAIRTVTRTIEAVTAPTTVAFSPDGAVTAIGTATGGIDLVRTATGAEEATLHTQGAVAGLTFTPDGARLVASGHSGPVGVWDAHRYGLIGTLGEASIGLTDVAVSPDGAMVAGARERDVLLWNRATMPAEHTDTVTALAASPDGRELISAGVDGRIVFSDLATHKVRLVTEVGKPITGLVVSPDGRLLAAHLAEAFLPQLQATFGDLQLRSTTDGSLAGAGGPFDTAGLVGFDRSGRYIATGPAPSGWDVAAGKSVSFPDCQTNPTSLSGNAGQRLLPAYAPGPNRLIEANQAGDIFLCDGQRRYSTYLFQGGADLTRLALDPAGTTAALAYADGTVALWNLTTCTRIAVLTTTSGASAVLAFSPDGRYLAAAGHGRNIDVWSASSWRHWATLTGPAQVTALVWSPDGRTIHSAADDHTVTSWTLDVDAALRRLRDT